jgi:hypothetical protein
MSARNGAHEIDIVSQLLAARRSSDPLEAAVKFLQYILNGSVVRLVTEPAGAGFAVPAGEIFEEHVAKGRVSFERASFEQAF